MATWKRILTEEDGTLATSDQTIDSGESRVVTLANNTTFTIQSSNVDAGLDNGALFQIFDSVSGGTQDILTLQANQTKLRVTGASNSVSGSLSFKEADNNGSHMVTLAAPASVASNITFTLPGTDGSNGHVLTTDGSGNLSFAAASGSGTIDGTGAADKIAIWSDSDTLTNDTDLSWISSSNTLSSVNFSASGSVTAQTVSADVILIAKQPDTNAAGAYDGAGSRIFSKIGSNTPISNGAGKVCYLGGSGTGTWGLADKDAESTSIGLLALYPNSGGPSIMVREGVVKMASNQGFSTAQAGTLLYLGDDGAVQTTVPGTGDIARIVGYVLNASSSIIYFCPDNSYVKVA